MSRSRMFDDDQPGANPSPRTTIVGGRPPERPSKLPPIPVGIQRLLRLASVDPGFLLQLVTRRGDVASCAGIELTTSEHAILAAIPTSALTAMALELPPPNDDRRAFLREAAAAAVVLLGGLGSEGCDRDRPAMSAGIMSDTPPLSSSHPPVRPNTRDMTTEGGIAPDCVDDGCGQSPERSDSREMTAGIVPDAVDRDAGPRAWEPLSPGAAPPMDIRIAGVVSGVPDPKSPPVPARPTNQHPTRGIRPGRPSDDE